MTARLGILLSGSGTTYAAVAEAIAANRLAAEIAVVVASKPGIGGIARAQANGHPVVVAADPDAVTAALTDHGAEWVAMCGWLKSWDPPTRFAGRTVNVHPALLPAFGGKGMYGRHVHAAVIARGCTLSGCTIHLVAGHYDSGPILAQQAVPVAADDTAETLQTRVQAAERSLYPQVLADLITGRLRPRNCP